MTLHPALTLTLSPLGACGERAGNPHERKEIRSLACFRQIEPQLGDRVLVIGQGLVGLLVTNMLVVAGARVIAVDVQPSRRPVCERMGAERVVIPGQQKFQGCSS